LERYGFSDKIDRLDKAGLIYQVTAKFAELDLSEQAVPNDAMGYIFEELLRKFSEMSNETAGEHFTPREVIRLMVNILFGEDDKALTGKKPVRTLYDPACGTGGMLTEAQTHLKALNPNAVLEVYGQELNSETWAIARSDLMIKGQDPSRIILGNSLTHEDGHSGEHFDYLLANPPFGVDWKKYAAPIQAERDSLGFEGRYGAGLPRVSDGSFLFLMHMLFQDEAGQGRRLRRHPPGDRLLREPVVRRRCGWWRVRDPPLDPGERLAGGHRRPARPDVLQHRHQHVPVDPEQPQGY